jgi:hypothetical protein
MLDVELFGVEPAGYHAENVAWHALNALLLLWALRRLTGRLWPSALVVALFAWHPLHVESVAWISERKGVLSTCLGLLCIGAYAAYARRGGIAPASAYREDRLDDRSARARRSGSAGLCCAAAQVRRAPLASCRGAPQGGEVDLLHLDHRQREHPGVREDPGIEAHGLLSLVVEPEEGVAAGKTPLVGQAPPAPNCEAT